MENAADALKLAFAVFVFVVALSITMHSFTNAKDAADSILWYSDKTNYYEWVESVEQKKGREVSKDAIIASLFKKQTDTFIIINKSSTQKYIFNYTGKVTEIRNGVKTVIDTNEVTNANYLINFVNEQLNDRDTYYENIVEVTNKGSLGGEYVMGDDGTKLQITQGENKVIVTYTRK